MITDAELEAMELALHLSARGLGTVSPNPAVGCVILSPTGQTLGQGWHERAGEDHAEVLALKQAGQAARGATAVVTLEPCAHTGRTGPCTTALISAGIARVIYASSDPGADSGNGAKVLRDAGIEVVGGELSESADRINRGWLTAQKLSRPYVTVKIASSLDGRVSGRAGQQRWITNEISRADGHHRRALADAVIIGSGTVAADNPALTVRDVEADLEFNPPLRVVIGQTPIANDAAICGNDQLFAQFFTHDLADVLAQLWQREVRTVLVEGGPTLVTAFFNAGLVDEVVVYLAPVLLGEGLSSIAELTAGSFGPGGESVKLVIDEVETMGDDIMIVAHPSTVLVGV